MPHTLERKGSYTNVLTAARTVSAPCSRHLVLLPLPRIPKAQNKSHGRFSSFMPQINRLENNPQGFRFPARVYHPTYLYVHESPRQIEGCCARLSRHFEIIRRRHRSRNAAASPPNRLVLGGEHAIGRTGDSLNCPKLIDRCTAVVRKIEASIVSC